jgi:dethiobiotin synthetase
VPPPIATLALCRPSRRIGAAQGRRIDLDVIERPTAGLRAVDVGGGGAGFRSSARTTCSTLRSGCAARALVGNAPGLLNHALLSAAAIDARGLQLSGWVANCIDPQMHAMAANIADRPRDSARR